MPVESKTSTGTTKLARQLLSRATQLLVVAKNTGDLRDMYRAVGMASECLDDADKLICSLPDSAVLGSRKTFEELTGRAVRAMRASA